MMKRPGYILIIAVFLFSPFYISCGKWPTSQTNFSTSNADSIKASSMVKNLNPVGKIVDLELPNDSGYILKRTGFELLYSLHLTDTAENAWHWINPPDTIGKYYRSSIPGHYVLCTIDHSHLYDFETHVLFELKELTKNKFEVLAAERYFHGNYPGCWTNYYEGFNKINDFFVMKTCGTGSAYSSSHLHFFRTVQPKDWDNSIESDCYAGYDGTDATILSSTFTLKDSTFTFKFLKKYVKYGKNFKVISSTGKSAVIIYDYSNGKMIPRDSTYINEFRIY